MKSILRISVALLTPLLAAAPSLAVNEITVKINGSTTFRNAGDPITVTLSGSNDTVNVYSSAGGGPYNIGRITIAWFSENDPSALSSLYNSGSLRKEI